MQGINRTKHIHLLDALLRFESLEKGKPGYTIEAKEHHQALETAYENYEILLNKLAFQITEYEDLFNQVKVQYLGRKLKELKKEIASESKYL